MIRLRVTKRTLRVIAWMVGIPAVLAILYFLGTLVTPLDGEGRPLILSPSLRAAGQYRRQAESWVDQMITVDARLTALLSDDPTSGTTELYTQSQEMQEVGELAAKLAKETATKNVPVALVGLRDQARVAADTYLRSALATARWLSSPSEAGRGEALEALREARALRTDLEESRWLTTETE